MSESSSGVADGYLHGFGETEQERLYAQARFLERLVFDQGVDFSAAEHIIELGCGVGAQTEILLRRFPALRVTAIDVSGAQLARAAQTFADHEASDRARFVQADALALPYPDQVFDGGFFCWFLEHVPAPAPIVAELHRVLRPGAPVICFEVLNTSLFIHPYSPATLQYWFAYNDHQLTIGGDPFIAAKLGNLLLDAGFSAIQTRNMVMHADRRMSDGQRAQYFEFWSKLLLSGAPELIEAGKVSQRLVDDMRRELHRASSDPDGVLYYTALGAYAEA